MKYTSFLTFLVVVIYAALLVSADVNITSSFARRAKRSTSGTGTWYSGGDLDDAYCYGRNGLPNYTPKSSDMIASIKMKGLSYCYKCVKITYKKKSITLRVVDDCAGCGNSKDVDMTTSAFKSLEPDLNVGELKITWSFVTCPKSGKWLNKP